MPGRGQAGHRRFKAEAGDDAPAEGDSLAAQVQAMQEIEYQRLRAEGLEVQSKAMAQFERGETDAALEIARRLRQKVKAIEARRRQHRPARSGRSRPSCSSSSCSRPRRTSTTNVVTNARTRFAGRQAKERVAEMKKQQQVKDLMKQFNTLYKEGKYKEAELAAAKAHELDPDDPVVEAAVQARRRSTAP